MPTSTDAVVQAVQAVPAVPAAPRRPDLDAVVQTVQAVPAVPAVPRRPDLDALVDATPASRDRVVDLLRVVSVCVVVVWHWSLSLTHWRADGVLVMPNPIADVPGGWAATWVLQVTGPSSTPCPARPVGAASSTGARPCSPRCGSSASTSSWWPWCR